jgi:hypothetical protein
MTAHFRVDHEFSASMPSSGITVLSPLHLFVANKIVNDIDTKMIFIASQHHAENHAYAT